ncbi:hypothetical protein X738_21845 [Mesorhizobium sp. LNHC209A00]|nr:hypothetical protein X738_21845 [Mesorhizobium sp. LNHC209A00]
MQGLRFAVYEFKKNASQKARALRRGLQRIGEFRQPDQ